MNMTRRTIWQAGVTVLSMLVGFLAVSCNGSGPSVESQPSAAAEAGDAVVSDSSPPVMEDPGSISSISPAEVLARLDEPGGPVLIDVRSREEYAEGHIPGAINIPYDRITDRLEDLQQFEERGIVLYCRTGRRAGIAESALLEAGFENLRDLDGHMVEWLEAGLPVEPASTCC
jgi:rhodanese-related sulfurtransferase